jgi:uncharacterized protein (TIGR02117 family)
VWGPERPRAVLKVVIVLVASVAAGCTAPPVPPSLSAPTGPAKDVWVVQHSWHSRIAVRVADVDPAVWPESRDVGDVGYLEAGWGDRDFYPKEHPSVWDAIDPVIRATDAALHVGGLDRSPAEFFAPGTPVVQLRVSDTGFAQLTRFVHDHYVRDSAGRPQRIQRGHYEHSWFYLATGRYHALFNNSNMWVANALRAAELPVDPRRAVTAGALMEQARALAPAPRPRRRRIAACTRSSPGRGWIA